MTERSWVTRRIDSLLSDYRATAEPQEEPYVSPVEKMIRSDPTLYEALLKRRAEREEQERQAQEAREGMELFEELADLLPHDSFAELRNRLTQDTAVRDAMLPHIDEPEGDPRIIALESRAETMEARGASDVADQLRMQAQAIRGEAAARTERAQALADATTRHYSPDPASEDGADGE